jgi:NADH dehydrogenase
MGPHVVILGGGFGGIAAARALGGSDARVTILDRRNHHLFQPLLYQVATAGLAPSDIAEPIRSITARHRNIKVRLAEVLDVDAANRRVQIEPEHGSGTEWVDYDHLIVAIGVQQSWFGREDWRKVAPGLKTIRDALEIRRRLILAFEAAEWTDDVEERAKQLTFIVVGGGPTGVELAGAISEIACSTFRHDFQNVDTSQARVILVEAADGVLRTYDERLQAKAKRQLEELGVEVRLESPVEEVDEDGVVVDGERIRAGTVLWAAGMTAPKLAESLPGPKDKAGRLKVQPDGSVEGHREIFAVGDIAYLENEDGEPLPGVAPVAMGMGKHAARCILDDIAGRERQPFSYFDKGQMATIGRSRAILESGRLRMAGLFAWLAWVFVHLIFLVTFRNRLVVFTKWAWAWLTYERASRLVWQTDVETPASPVEVRESA